MSNAVDMTVLCDAIYSWINSRKVVKAQHIILEDPNVERPARPYVSYRFLTGPAMIGTRDDHVNNGTDDDVIVSGPRRITLSLKAYGDNEVSNQAMQIITNLHGSFQLLSVGELFNTNNMAVWGYGTPTELSSELETGIEDRAGMDVIFGVTSIQVEDEGGIDSVVVKDAILKDADGTTVQTINETITKP